MKDFNLEDIAVKKDELDKIIRNRLNHRTFARALLFCWKTYQQDGFIYASDLSKFMRITKARAWQILNNMVNLGLLFKTSESGTTCYKLVKTSNNYAIEKYLDDALRTMGLKPLKKLTEFKIKQKGGD